MAKEYIPPTKNVTPPAPQMLLFAFSIVFIFSFFMAILIENVFNIYSFINKYISLSFIIFSIFVIYMTLRSTVKK